MPHPDQAHAPWTGILGYGTAGQSMSRALSPTPSGVPILPRMSTPDPSTEAELARLHELYDAYEQARAAEQAAYAALAQQARHVKQQGLSLEAIAASLGVYKARVQYWVRPVKQRPRVTPDRRRPPTRGAKADQSD